MTRIGLVLDCADPDELARFWAPALGYTIVGGAGAYVLLVPPTSAWARSSSLSVASARAWLSTSHWWTSWSAMPAYMARCAMMNKRSSRTSEPGLGRRAVAAAAVSAYRMSRGR